MPIRGPFRSILFDDLASQEIVSQQQPEFFRDLNLDQIVSSMTEGRDEYNLLPFFYTPVTSVQTVRYRYDVLRDLEHPALLGFVHSFAQRMRRMRAHLAQEAKLHYRYQRESWFLDAVAIYCDAVSGLNRDLEAADCRSEGFLRLREFLRDQVRSDAFLSLVADSGKLKEDLSNIRYSLYIAGKRITVTRYEPEEDYGADVLRTFEKFKQTDATKEYQFEFPGGPDMDHVEAAILDLVAKLNPAVFAALDEFATRRTGYLNEEIASFDREVQFYVACLDYRERLKRLGLPTCYPEVTDSSKQIYGRSVFDFALADSLARSRTPVVTNDFHLDEPERIILVSGPNQGGKTTFARTFGQMHYLAGIGAPVAGSEAKLFLCDVMFTHFEKEEDIRNLSSKLEDDLRRIHGILERATPRSILIMNESFLSTSLSDALFLSRRILLRIIELDMICVSVTFLDELTAMTGTAVSMVSTVNPQDPVRRTFKVIRKPADGLAYAAAIAEKYHVTFRDVKKRIGGKVRETVRS